MAPVGELSLDPQLLFAKHEIPIDNFPEASLGGKEPEIMVEGHGGAAESVMISLPPPSNVAAGFANNDETSSAKPSAKYHLA
ncbi:hypothetical protein Clacol_003374 [Clathrus columnatus]|uniref:Uncharacterized protein n=1 Tax=Clathrus columnatus TaxID=1419009 RepID=A0AAV5A3G4_9AGAM|nr:hypothetical protein Clacol_003374 [Clathrus columnatus]